MAFNKQVLSVGDKLLSPQWSIIASTGLNFSVRNGKRCTPCDESPTLNTHLELFIFYFLRVICNFPNRNRAISTSRLNTLLCVHLKPINVIISYGPQTISYLKTGFPLRCFQRLSIPDIATEQSNWR